MKKIIIFAALLGLTQIIHPIPPPKNDPETQQIVDALVNSTTLDGFLTSSNISKNPKYDSIVKIKSLKNEEFNTHQGKNTFYEYAQQLNKKYFIDMIDYFTVVHLMRTRNWQELKNIMNQPNFNPNLSMVSEIIPEISLFELLLRDDQAPLDVIQGFLNKETHLRSITKNPVRE